MVEITSVKADLPSLNFLIYADSGAGKTVFAGSAERVLFIAPEDKGLLSAAMTGSKADKIKVTSWADMEAAYEYCYDNQFELAEKYDWIAIDSLTYMQGMLLRDIVANERAKRIAKDQDPEVPQIQDYQKLYILMERMVLAFNDLAINVIYTALTRNVEDADGNEFLLPMLGSNKATDYRVAMTIASHMTSYGHFRVEIVSKEDEKTGKSKKVKQRVIYFEDNGVYRGKDRTTRLGSKLVLPPKMALQHVTDLATGKSEPAKKAPAKKAVPRVEKGTPNPANTPDTAADISDSVPQYKEGDDQESLELSSVEA